MSIKEICLLLQETITFAKDSSLAITNISQTGTTPTTDGFTFDFTTLMPGEMRFIDVSMQVPVIPNVALGDLLSNSVSVTTPENDIHPLNNTSDIVAAIVGSYDPNDKTENHGGKILHSAFSANDYLTYTIRFENTGTAEAINVMVKDVLDAQLDETSVRMITASHPYVLDRVGNNLTWRFDAIQLPPSQGSSTVGHGYIVFEVKPKADYAIGDIIPNSADIYFDFNPAIVTDPCLTEFVATLETKGFTSNEMTVYPNPTNSLLYLSTKTNASKNIDIIDVLGKTVMTKDTDAAQTQIDLSGLSPGIYLLKVKTADVKKALKIVKQ